MVLVSHNLPFVFECEEVDSVVEVKNTGVRAPGQEASKAVWLHLGW